MRVSEGVQVALVEENSGMRVFERLATLIWTRLRTIYNSLDILA